MNKNIKSTKGFTLVEMLGVLAIIAILVSIVSVGVMTAIKNARITGTLANLKNYETALAAHVTLNEGNGFIPVTKSSVAGAVPISGTVTQDNVHVGQVLIASGALENLPTWRVGREVKDGNTASAVWNIETAVFEDPVTGGTLIDWADRIHAEAVTASDPTGLTDADIDEAAWTANFVLPVTVPEGATIVYIKLLNVGVADAVKLSESLNRNVNTATAAAPVQTVGRFVFGAGVGTQPTTAGVVNCYYYLGNF